MTDSEPAAVCALEEVIRRTGFLKLEVVPPLLAFCFGAFFPVCEHCAFSGPFSKNIYMKEDHIEVEGVVSVVLPGTMFRVELDNKHMVLATICGKMRKRWVRLTAGDRVKMEMSPYDLDKARITWRLR